MDQKQFEVGDYVKIVCTDASEYEGFIQTFEDDVPVPYFVLDPGPRGFPFEDVLTMDYA